MKKKVQEDLSRKSSVIINMVHMISYSLSHLSTATSLTVLTLWKRNVAGNLKINWIIYIQQFIHNKSDKILFIFVLFKWLRIPSICYKSRHKGENHAFGNSPHYVNYLAILNSCRITGFQSILIFNIELFCTGNFYLLPQDLSKQHKNENLHLISCKVYFNDSINKSNFRILRVVV